MSNNAKTEFIPDTPYQLRLVAKIAVSVAFVAALSLALTVYFMTDPSQGSAYWMTIKSIYATKKLVGPTLLIAALILISVIGFITWSISIYSTARITGALYRFSRNLEIKINGQSVPFVSIRRGDHLLNDARQLEQANQAIKQHYLAVNRLCEEIAEQLANDQAPKLQIVNHAINKLKQLEQTVRLDHE